MKNVIETRELAKTYRGSWRKPPKGALNGVSLEIAEGETFGFIGPNGAGKSTLIKILLGLIRPTSGSASLFSLECGVPESRRGLGFVPENPSLQDHLTPYEIVRMGLHLHGVRVESERKHCLSWLDRFDLLSVANVPIRSFSKGMAQRTVLAHAMAIKPRLLILDEPLSGLDPVGRKDVVDVLSEYRSGGGTLFFSSHVLFDVERIADRFGLIHNGRLVTVRSPRDLAQDQADRYSIRYRSTGKDGQYGVFDAESNSTELPEAIGRLQTKGFVIQEVRPSASLESVFFKAIAGDDPAQIE